MANKQQITIEDIKAAVAPNPAREQAATASLAGVLTEAIAKVVKEENASQNRAIVNGVSANITGMLQEIIEKQNILSAKIDAMTAPKKVQPIKAATTTEPAPSGAPAPVKQVKAPKATVAVDPLAKTFSNKLHYINAIAYGDRALYEKIIPADLIAKARAHQSYVSLAKVTEPIDFEKTPQDLVKKLRKAESNEVYKMIKEGGEHTPTLNALDRAMREHKGNAAPAKIETLEGSD
jgi:hypothetical protein